MGQSLCLQWIGSAECVTSVGVLCLCVGKLFWFGDILRGYFLALLVHMYWGVSLGSQTSSGEKWAAGICSPLLMLFGRVVGARHTIRIHPSRVCSWARGLWCSLLSVPKPAWGKGVWHSLGLPRAQGWESFDKAGPCTKILNDSISWLLFIPTC